MDIERVNGFLARAQTMLSEGEGEVLAALTEMDDTNAPDGDPDDGPSASGVNNDSAIADQIVAFLMTTASQVAAQFDNLEDEEALSFALELADKLSDDGVLPEFPDPDTADDQVMIMWLGSANKIGYAAKLADYISSDN
jgi:hypothetical protein